MGFKKGFGRRSKLGSASIFRNCLFRWMVQGGVFGFGGGSFCSISFSSIFLLKGLADQSLVFLLLLALWLFLPPLKLEPIEVGLLRWLSSNLSLTHTLIPGYYRSGSLSTTSMLQGGQLNTISINPSYTWCFLLQNRTKSKKGKEAPDSLLYNENMGKILVARKWSSMWGIQILKPSTDLFKRMEMNVVLAKNICQLHVNNCCNPNIGFMTKCGV